MINSVLKMMGSGIIGFSIGGLLGFLLRPAVFIVGQLPFNIVVSRGTTLTGVDRLLIPVAQKSFDIMLTSATIGAAIALIIIGYFLQKDIQIS